MHWDMLPPALMSYEYAGEVQAESRRLMSQSQQTEYVLWAWDSMY